MKKGLKITISIVSLLLMLLIIFFCVYYFWPWNKDFFDNATEEFSIPGLDEGFCPQGMTKIEGYDKYLISGYMTDGSPSRFYVINAEDNSIEKYVTLNIDGKQFDGHAGGVVSFGSTIWTVSYVGDRGYGFRFMLNELLVAENGEEIIVDRATDCFETYNNADFVFAYDDYLWVGEFYKEGKYETDEQHHLITRSGEINTAIVYGFKIDESYKFGLYSSFPKKALSIRGLCQGMAVTSDGKFVMSTSYSIPDSNIYYYKDVLNENAHNKEFKVGLTQVDLWYLDNYSLISTTNAPAMSEEVVVENNRVYILFESACKKYKMFNRKRLTNVYSLPVTYLEK
ncbi:MAG: hypothetical protein ACI4PF_05175 [Christensenellales bacterium]